MLRPQLLLLLCVGRIHLEDSIFRRKSPNPDNDGRPFFPQKQVARRRKVLCGKCDRARLDRLIYLLDACLKAVSHRVAQNQNQISRPLLCLAGVLWASILFSEDFSISKKSKCKFEMQI